MRRDRAYSDPVNSALNYGYTVLRGHAIAAVVSAGLYAGWGVFHRGVGNQFALADDLIEPFRPAVDNAVLNLLPDLNMELPEHKRALAAAASTLMGNGLKTVSSEMTLTAQSIGAFFEDHKHPLHIPSWRGL